MPTDFFHGIRYLLTGLRLVTRAPLRRELLWPVLISASVFFAAAWALVQLFMGLAGGWLPEWMPEWLIDTLVIVTALPFALIVAFLVASLVSAPLNGRLARRVEMHLTQGRTTPMPGESLPPLREARLAMTSELRKFAWFAARALPLLLLFLIPVVNLAAPFLWFLFSAWFLAIETLDYPAGNHGLFFTEQRRWLRARPSLTLGFGSAALLLLMVPVLNLLALSAGIAGASALWVGEDGGAVTAEPSVRGAPGR